MVPPLQASLRRRSFQVAAIGRVLKPASVRITNSGLGMKWIRVVLFALAALLYGAEHTALLLAQQRNVAVEWKAQLAKAKAGIAKGPKSEFRRNQAGVAYDARGDLENAVKELSHFTCTSFHLPLPLP